MSKRVLHVAPVLLVVLLAVATGCKASQASPPERRATRVTQIVFIGKENACDCTRTRIQASWAALQAALRGNSGIRIERLQVDRNRDRLGRFESMRPIMALPAVYLLDSAGALVEMLQGEITAEQFRRALQRRSTPASSARISRDG